MSKKTRRHITPELNFVPEDIPSYKDFHCLKNLCSADDIFDRFKYDHMLMFKNIRQGVFDLDNVYIREDECMSNLGLGRRPFVNTHMCNGCAMLRNLFSAVKIPQNRIITIQAGKNEGKRIEISEYNENYEPYESNKELDYIFQKISKIQNILNILEDSQFIYNNKIKILSTQSNITNYAITCIFLNNKMSKYKIPNQILFDWIYSCDNKIKIVKPIHNSFSELSNLETLNKNIKSATAQIKISPLNEKVVISILKQLVCILHFYSKYSFIHGRPCLEYLQFTNKPCSYKYADLTIDSPITLHLEPSLYTSFSYETDNKTNYRLVSNKDSIEIPNFLNLPIESIDIIINNKPRQVSDNFEIPMILELKKHLVYCYKIGDKNFEFINFHTKYGIPILSDSFEFYCFLICLMFEDSFYTTFMENMVLSNIWKNLWKSSEFEDMTNNIILLKQNDILNYETITSFISKYHLRSDIIKYFYECMTHI